MHDDIFLSKCPACHARFQGDESPDTPCRRCHADVRSLRLCYQQVRFLCREVRLALAKQQSVQALRMAKHALRLVEHPITKKLFACAFQMHQTQQKQKSFLEEKGTSDAAFES